MKKKVLLVEDARDMQLMVTSALGETCDLMCAGTIADARREMGAIPFDLIILDVNLPDGDGFEFCKYLRAQEMLSEIPIIFLTGETEILSRVMGFELGADDYVTKPLEPNEFTARVLGKLKRSKKAQTSFRLAGFRVDLNLQKVFETSLDGTEKVMSLTPIECKLLSHFLQHAEKVFSRQELLAQFWGHDVHVSEHTVDTHISSLRKKMGASGSHLQSVFKKGYCFTVTPEKKTA